MRTGYTWVLAGLLACTKAGPTQDSIEPPPREPTFAQPPEAKLPPPAPAPTVTVAMTAATLADDCGGVAPAPAPRAKAEQRSDESAEASRARGAAAKRACEQSSMQLSVIAPAGAAASQLSVKKVELYDDKGALVGALTPRAPTVWAQDGTYTPWDQKIAAGQELSVSYALSQPPWGEVTGRWNRTYVVKAVITVGGTDRSVQFDVHVAAPTMLPPNVRT
jgi:hypothetical protein